MQPNSVTSMSDSYPTADSLFLSFQSALAGRYSILRELGRGGMGVVYLAREVHLDRLVAIKLLPPEKANRPQLRERFLREARLAAKLSHPHIIPIHAVDQVDGFVFFVMSYVEGETLADRVRNRGPVSASDGVRMLREAAWALGYAHTLGVVHRDVKPDNILIEASTGRALADRLGRAIDQRRMLPVALRAFVKRNGRMDGWGTMLYASALLITSTGLSAALGVTEAFVTFAAGVVIAPFGFAVVEARRLLRQGFAHADLGPAFRTELENAREERAVGRSRGRLLEWMVSRVTRISASFIAIAITAIAVGLAFAGSRPIATSAIPITVATVVVGIFAGTTYLAMLQARRDVDTEFWSALWM